MAVRHVEVELGRCRMKDARLPGGAINKTSEGLSAAATVAKRRFWPVVGVLRGVRAIARAMAERRRQSVALMKLDQDAQQRFSYEGGSHARTSNVR